MVISNTKKLSVVLFFIFFIAAGAAVYNPPQQPGNWKNLKILPKDISRDSLDKVMDQFKTALGVKCGFCHAMAKDTIPKKHLDFASDEKDEKNTARFMMKMTSEINAHYFNFEKSSKPDTIRAVTCITCHRGLSQPDAEGIAKQMEMLPKPQQPAPPPPAPGHKE
jgi:hypothetical protein